MLQKKWAIFIKERFDPLSHFLMIIVFVTIHILFSKKIFNLENSSLDILFLLVAVTLFYFKLRLYDEVKDYELDVIINPHRPLPRGLLSHKDMYRGMVFCIFFEILFFSSKGINAITSLGVAIFYSLLMFKEFFIPKLIRPHLTTYAISHTIVTSLLSMAIFSFLNQKTFVNNLINHDLIFFSLSNWMLFNIFEFGRKTFALTEERAGIDTYSSLFGKKLAVLLVLSQALLSFFLTIGIKTFHTPFIIISNIVVLVFLILSSLMFIKSEKISNAKNYRSMSSIYIIVFYLILIIGLLIN
jgi:4-hydroxybenzoate polyprenyltransferase